jgi:hypothetical protein
MKRIQGYCVYERGYDWRNPDARYKFRIPTLKEAQRWARKFGPGAEIVRWYETTTPARGDLFGSAWPDPREWVYKAKPPGRYRKK